VPNSKRGAADGATRGNRLVIVESPAKARTIAGYLGRGYVVESSIGHIRDLPDKAADIPAKYKKEPWARLGVNVDAGFEPLYVVNPDKKQQVGKLRKLMDQADELLLATDEDREGEAIAWHLLEVLKPKVPARRMVFHEITPEAIATAVASPRELNQKLVDAQETRRILDRLYGYEVSPVLWKKVMPRLSAGRVQSVATRLIVERERERIAFRTASYWDIEAVFGSQRGDADPPEFAATLVTLDGRRVAQGRDFSSAAQLKTADAVHLYEADAAGLAQRLTGADFTVRSVEKKPYRRSPYAPFRTTTLQQEASRKLGFSAKYTMSVAQRLYENGHITYMRTDSITLSETAIAAARAQARQLFGAEYVPDRPRVYTSKVKNAQEAHEAIRPAGDEFATPSASRLTGDEFRLYELVWKRTVASQMKDAAGESVSVRVVGRSSAGEDAEFGASGKVITFHGFLKAYVEDADDPETDREDAQHRLPPLAADDPLTVVSLAPAGHHTRPPARYTEAALVKELEDREIGRPSTYASIIGTILDRGYVFRKGTALVPSFLAFAVVTLLERHFGHLVDYDFTARMEDVLDEIARGEAARVPWLRRFYFGEDGGNGEEGLKDLVSDLGDIDAREVSSFPLPGTAVVVRVGRYGPYLERDGERVNVPEGTAPDELTPARAEELFAQPSGERVLGTDPETGRTIVAKVGRYGPYVTELIDSAADGAPDKSARPGATAVDAGKADAGKADAGKADAGKVDAGKTDAGKDAGAEAKTAKSAKAKATKATKAKVAKAEAAKPRAASLLKTMTLDTVTLQDAMRLLTLPRVLGELDCEQVTVQNGRYGPYVKRGSDSRSLESEEQLFTLTLTEAKELFAKPKTRGRARGAAAPPLRELGEDPVTGKPLVIKSGRYGPYVTDGETNASLRKGDDVESITLRRGAELLAERRAAGPAPRRGKSGTSSRS
jgi:DNA topoisomerase-1